MERAGDGKSFPSDRVGVCDGGVAHAWEHLRVIVGGKEFTLPGQEPGRGLVPVGGELHQDGFAGDEGWIEVKGSGVAVPASLEGFPAQPLCVSQPFALGAQPGGPLVGRQVAGRFDGRADAGAAAGRDVPGDVRGRVFVFGAAFREEEKEFVAEDEVGGVAGGDGRCFAPAPESAENRQSAWIQAVGSFDAPGVWIGGEVRSAAILNETGAGLRMPLQASMTVEVLPEVFGDGVEMAGVVSSVLDHAGRQRASGPVGLLDSLVQGQTQERAGQVMEGELGPPEEPGGHHGVEDLVRHKTAELGEEAQVVVGPVEDQFPVVQGFPEGLEMKTCERVDEGILTGDADLQQAEFLRIRMQAIRLGVEGDPIGQAQAGGKGGQRFLLRNHAGSKRCRGKKGKPVLQVGERMFRTEHGNAVAGGFACQGRWDTSKIRAFCVWRSARLVGAEGWGSCVGLPGVRDDAAHAA